MNDTLGKLTESLLAGLASEANNPDAFDDLERKQREAIQDEDCFYPRSIDAHDDDDHRHYKAVGSEVMGTLIPPPVQGDVIPLKRPKSKRFMRKKKRRKPDC